MRQNIPQELRELDQWVVSGPDKKPINPRTGQLASPTDPRTWGTFNEAMRSAYPNIGFVLTKQDPYCIIDLDNKPDKPASAEELERHTAILNTFQSYTERSQSGYGYHIVLRGSVPSGVHRDSVEIYSDARYMIFTGDVIKGLPISGDYQHLLDNMYSQMAPMASTDLEQIDGEMSDADLVAMAMRASNGAKFNALCQGDLTGYPSQSEADFALLSIFCFYTRDNNQVRRLFRMSQLGKREKAVKNDTYLNFALKKIRAKEPAPIDFSALETNVAKLPPTVEEIKPELHGITLPPGLIGEIAEYIYHSAVRPVPEVALAAAIAYCSGICGRSYNISGTGLNQYILLLAKTGAGKEGASNGIDRLSAALRQSIPIIDQFVGPAAFASGQAIIKTLDETPCFCSVLGEFGITLQQICSPRANSAEVLIKRVLLDLYTKSGWDKVLRSSVYSDKEKNTKIVQAPNMTILGESTPETFFEGLDSSHISEGLIPRFTCIEYTGKRPPRNRAAGAPPSKHLIQRLADLVTVALTTTANNTCATIQIQADALAVLDAFDTSVDECINGSNYDVEAHLWNRAHLKALKLAGLVAVGCNPHSPQVTKEQAEWAINFVKRDIEIVASRFRSGDVGTGDSKQLADVKRVIKHYFDNRKKVLTTTEVNSDIFDAGLIPHSYLSRRTLNLSSFKNDRRGSSGALKNVLQEMVDSGFIVMIDTATMEKKYKFGGKCYGIRNAWVD